MFLLHFFSLLVNSLTCSFITKGHKSPLLQDDLYELNDDDRAGAWAEAFAKYWDDETERLNRLVLQLQLVNGNSLLSINFLCYCSYLL